MNRYVILALIALLATVGAACQESQPTPAPAPTSEPTIASVPPLTPEPPIDQLLEELDKLRERLTQLEEQITGVPAPTPTPEVSEGPTPAPEPVAEKPIATPQAATPEEATRAPETTTGTPAPVPGATAEKPTRTHEESMEEPTPAPGTTTATPTPVPETTVQTPTPTAVATTEKPAPTPEATTEKPAIQEVGIIENYAATRFFPRNIVVLKDVPVRLYLTRLHREHVNKFTIEPFFSTSEVVLPGEIGVMEFLPDQVGEFKIHNVGHGFDATLVVVETIEEKNRYIAERGRQMYALIHSVDEFQIFPDRLVMQVGIPATIHNISLVAEHKVSFKPFHDPEDFNVRPRAITPIAFTPDSAGEFTILHEIHGFTGTLVVEATR